METNFIDETLQNIKKDNIQSFLVIVLWVLLFIVLCLYVTKQPKIQTINEQRLEIKNKAETSLSWTLKARDEYQKKVDILNWNVRVLQKCIDDNSNTWVLVDCNLKFKK